MCLHNEDSKIYFISCVQLNGYRSKFRIADRILITLYESHTETIFGLTATNFGMAGDINIYLI